MLKNFFITAILLAFVFNLFGYYLPFFLIRSEYKNEIDKAIEGFSEGELIVKLTFSSGDQTNQPEWLEKGKEFRYNDEMFDVVKAVTHNDSVTYYCFCDSKEKELILKFKDLVNNNLDSNKKSKIDNEKKLSKYNLNKIKLTSIKYSFNELDNSLPLFYKSLDKKIDLPPPKFL